MAPSAAMTAHPLQAQIQSQTPLRNPNRWGPQRPAESMPANASADDYLYYYYPPRMVVIDGSFLFCPTLKGGSTSFLKLFDEVMGTKGTTHAVYYGQTGASCGGSGAKCGVVNVTALASVTVVRLSSHLISAIRASASLSAQCHLTVEPGPGQDPRSRSFT